MATLAETQRGSKKRKKSFLQNARGMGKKKKFGAGTSLDEDTYSYFVRVLELLQGNFDTEEEKMALVENVLVQTAGHEVDYSSNQVGCRVIETLVNLAPGHALKPFMDAFDVKLRIVTTHRFASHVLQALLSSVTRAGLVGTNPPDEVGNKANADNESLPQDLGFAWVSKVAKFVMNNFEEFVWDEYANHVIRTVLACLAGSPPEQSISNCNVTSKGKLQFANCVHNQASAHGSEKSNMKEFQTPSEFHSILEDFFTRIYSYNQFTELAFNNLTSALLQVLISVCAPAHPKLKKKLIKQLIETVFRAPKSEKEEDISETPKTVAPVFTTNASIRMLEAVLEYASTKQLLEIYTTCFKESLIDLSCDLTTNFSVQCLLSRCTDKDMFTMMFEELRPGFGKIIESGMYGVILAVCNACKRLLACQWNFIEAMMQALDCWEPMERRNLIAPLVACMRTYDSFQDMKSKPAAAVPSAKDGVTKSSINLHGSLVIQTMLTFNKPISIVKSILHMPGTDIFAWMCDTKGSHILDSYFKSEYVGEKNRELLTQHLEGYFPNLAVSKCGSRSLEVILATSNQKHQLKIMEELSAKADLVRSSKFGQIVASKWGLDVFKRRRNDWIGFQNRKENTKERFSKIIGNSAVKTKMSKKV